MSDPTPQPHINDAVRTNAQHWLNIVENTAWRAGYLSGHRAASAARFHALLVQSAGFIYGIFIGAMAGGVVGLSLTLLTLNN